MSAFDPDGVGLWGEPVEFEVTRDRIAEYASATNWPLAGEAAPPLFAIVPVFPALAPAALAVAPIELVPGMVHGEQDFRFARPIVPGQTLVSRARPIGYRGGPTGTRVVLHVECREAGGNLVNEQWVTLFFRGYDAGGSVGEVGPGRTPGAAPGDPVAVVTQHVDEDQTFRYASAAGDPMPIHLDEEIARMAGLPGIIVHGMCTMAFASWAVVESMGGGEPARLRRLAARFRRPVLPGQDLTTRIWPLGEESCAFESTVDNVVVMTGGLAELAGLGCQPGADGVQPDPDACH